VHHIMPLAGGEDLRAGDYAVVSKEMNAKMSKYNVKINKLVNEAYDLDYSKTSSLKRLDTINNELFDILKTVKKDLPKEYKGLLGFNKLTPVLDTFDDKGKQVFSAEPQGIDYKKSIAGERGDKIRNIKRSNIQDLVNKAPKFEITKKQKQKITNLIGELACGVKSANGGRINFSNGSSCNVRGKKILERIVSTGKGTKAELSAAQKILNFGKGAFSLKGLVGPQALLFEAAIAAGSVGYDVAAGKPLKEAIGNNLNLILGPKWKQDVEAMEFDRLKGSGVDIDQLKQLATAYKQSDAMSKLYNRQYSLEQNKDNLDLESFEGVDMQSREKELKQLNMTINELEKPSGFNVIENITKTIADPKILRNQDMATDILKTQEANRSILPDFTTAPIFDTRYTNKKMGEMKELSPSYSDQDIDKILTGYGRDPKEFNYKYTPINFPGDTSSKPVTGRDDVRDFFKIQDQTQKIADAGGIANMAGGGIAGLSGGDPEGAMTKSMNPDSQGLRSLFNNGKKR